MSEPTTPNKSSDSDLTVLLTKARETLSEIETGKSRALQLSTDANASLENIKRIVSEIEEARKAVANQTATAEATLANNLNEAKKAVSQFTTDAASSLAALRDKAEEIEQLKNSAETQKSTIETDAAIITKTKDLISQAGLDVQDKKTSLIALEGEVRKKSAEVNAAITSLENDRKNLDGIVQALKALQTQATDSKDAAAKDAETVADSKRAFDELATQTQAAHAELKAQHETAKQEIAVVHAAYEHISKERADLLEDVDVEGVTKRSIANSIRQANTELTALLTNAKEAARLGKEEQDRVTSEAKSQWEGDRADLKRQLTELDQQSRVQVKTLKTDLENEIKRLLPGAGAAGLASAYVDAKSSYGPIKFEYTGDKNGTHWHKMIGAWLAYVVRNYAAPVVFYAMFVGPVAVFAWFFYDLLDFFKSHPEKFDPSLFLLRVGISVPLLTLSWFGWNSIRLHRQLFEEYNHKQRVMQLYDSFKKEIEKSGTPEQHKALLGIMLATVADKPSLAMHKYDKGFESLVPNLSLGNIGSIFGLSPKGAESEAVVAPHVTEPKA